jgi:TldD protein
VYLHEAVGHGLEADFNRKRTSNFSDRIGQKVASELCTVVDDGTLGHLYGSINVDDEAAPGQRNVLIENGVLRAYMHDWISARHFGVPQSGNGRRETFRHFPMPRMTNTYMMPGQDDPQDIVRSVKRGVYCVSFKGGQVNISNGDFVFSAREAYLIEDGRITAPIRDVTLIGNGPDSLSRVTMVGHDWVQAEVGGFCGKNGQRMIVSFGQPTILVDGIVVGGTQFGH